MLAVLRAVRVLFVFFMLLSFSTLTAADSVTSGTYDIYVTAQGDLFLKAKNRIIIIASDIAIPIVLPPSVPDRYFTFLDGNYTAASVPAFDASQLTLSDFLVHVGDFDGNGASDFFLQAKRIGANSLLLLNPGLSGASVQAIGPDVFGFDLSTVSGVTVRVAGNKLIIKRVGFTEKTAYISADNTFDGSLSDEFNQVGAIDLGSVKAAGAVGKLSGAASVSKTGSLSYLIPLDLPDGSGGLKPALSLAYDSAAGNGLMGKGWSLSGLQSIARCPQTIAQGDAQGLSVSLTDADRLCLNGQRLQLVSGAAYWSTLAEYRTEIESFNKVVTRGSAAERWFEVYQKNGLIAEFRPVKALGDAKGKNLVWVNTGIRDRSGNKISIEYNEQDDGSYYPDYLTYGTNRVDFIYTNNRSDAVTRYVGGARQRNEQLLRKVSVSTLSNGQDARIREYNLVYSGSDAETGYLLLDKLQLCGYSLSGAQESCLPPTALSWSQDASAWPVTGVSTTADFATDTLVTSFPLDWNGDGIQDIATADDKRIYVAQGSASGLGDPVLINGVSVVDFKSQTS